jgi:methionyl-tRNA synthetase
VEFREEENYYFKLGQHKDWLLSYLDAHKDAVIPKFRQTELRNAVERISADLCISRPKSRLDWGIELPFDKNFVTYVWFDALTNYITFVGYDPSKSNIEHQTSNFLDKWPALQIIGKDVLVPAHGIYWLIMLHAIGFPDDQMPQLLVHGWWNIGGAKMSKSVGNIVDPFILSDKYNADTLRYYLMRDMATGQDADFSEERLVERYNSDLANSLGNLLNRTLNMVHRYRNGKLLCTWRSSGRLDPADAELGMKVTEHDGNLESVTFSVPSLQFDAEEALDRTTSDMDDFDPEDALQAVSQFSSACDHTIEMTAPWKLMKDPEAHQLLDQILYSLAESLRIIAILISPVTPRAAHGIFNQLNWKMELSGKEERFSLADAEWGRLPDGHVVGKPVPLFPRIEE